MNNLNITVELCAEDRARADKIIDLLESLIKQNAPIALEADPLRKALEQAVASGKATATEPAEAPQDETSAPTSTDTPAEPETPAEPAPAAQEEPKVTLADIQAKVIALVQARRKAEVREICLAYAPQVTQIPEDKWPEVLAKLNALEG